MSISIAMIYGDSLTIVNRVGMIRIEDFIFYKILLWLEKTMLEDEKTFLSKKEKKNPFLKIILNHK